MKRTAIIWSLIIVIAIGAVIGVSYAQNSMTASKQNAVESKKETKAEEEETTEVVAEASQQPGVFKDYQEGLVASTDGVKLLFFHAPWCPQCRMIEDDIEKQGVPSGVTVLKVDYDSNQALRKEYGVTLQTTFVKVDNNGTEIKKFVAYNEPNFDSVKENLLNE